MVDVIDSMRAARNQTPWFERCMSNLTVSIGDIERLTDLTPDQMERLWAATARLGNAAAAQAND